MSKVKSQEYKVALVGNPNVGKSSLFNELTGLTQKIGNFPGVTIDKKVGKLQLSENTWAEIIDLPGTYLLDNSSEDEEIATQYLSNSDEIDLVVLVGDAIHLKRSLLLFEYVRELKIPMILAVNMMDLAEASSLHISMEQLQKQLNTPIIPMNARIGKGVDQLKKVLKKELEDPSNLVDNSIRPEERDKLAFVDSVIEKVVNKKDTSSKLMDSNTKLDNLFIHPIWGYVIFLGILFLIFQAIFSWATVPMDLIEEGFTWLRVEFQNIFPEGILSDLIANGILAGLSGIVVFVPQIAILFVFLAILEDTGYLSRVSFLLDRSLRPFGLNGKSIIPLLSGTACAVPAIMSARSIGNQKERLITIFVTPLMSCSARIPVYTLLIALLISPESKLGIFNLQGVVMMGLYLFGAFAALFTGFVLNIILKKSTPLPFVFELPIYRLPRWKSVGITVYNKVRSFVIEAGKIIIAISIVLWVLSSYGPKFSNDASTIDYTSVESTNKLENSYAGLMGKTIEPVIRPLGFDWKIGISLVTSFAAREVFVGTMATLYAVDEEEGMEGSIRKQMLQAKWPGTSNRIYTVASIFSLLVFYAIALQCMSTLAVVKKETNSWSWALIQLVYLNGLAYLSSLAVYNILV